ncbi:MAG: winged helix DNA-binding domain-containing protein, partial [Sphingobacteriales bacterium]
MPMTAKQLLQLRLHNQQIAATEFKKPQEIVHWMGAMQAQDNPGAKWSVGLRLPGSTDSDIDSAINRARIVRTWTQRGTLHYMASQDVRWMLDLLAPRVLKSFSTQLRRSELDTALLKKCMKLLEKGMEGGLSLTRPEIKQLLESKKITTKDRLNYILVYASLEQLICHGPKTGNEFAFVLMDEWVRPAKKITNEEAMVQLAERYFTSHGPASLQDFIWWIGGTIKEATAALKAIEHKLECVMVNGVAYYFKDHGTGKGNGVYLLPGFDEYMLGYKDRSLALADEHNKKVTGAANGLFAA